MSSVFEACPYGNLRRCQAHPTRGLLRISRIFRQELSRAVSRDPLERLLLQLPWLPSYLMETTLRYVKCGSHIRRTISGFSPVCTNTKQIHKPRKKPCSKRSLRIHAAWSCNILAVYGTWARDYRQCLLSSEIDKGREISRTWYVG